MGRTAAPRDTATDDRHLLRDCSEVTGIVYARRAFYEWARIT